MGTECLKWAVFIGRRCEVYMDNTGADLGEKVMKLKSRAFGRRVQTNSLEGFILANKGVVKRKILLGRIRM